MPLKLTNEVSVVDIVAILGLVAGGITFVFGYGTDISDNTMQIAGIKTEIVRIEKRSEAKDGEILEQLRENREELKEYRNEARGNNREVNGKLDRLIERELNAVGH